MKKTIISSLCAAALAVMVFVSGATMVSASTQTSNDTTVPGGTTKLNVQAGPITLNTVPSFDFGAQNETTGGFTLPNVNATPTPIQVTDLRGNAAGTWNLTANASQLTLPDGVTELGVTDLMMAVAAGTNINGTADGDPVSILNSANTVASNSGNTADPVTAGNSSATITVAGNSQLQAGIYSGTITYVLTDSVVD